MTQIAKHRIIYKVLTVLGLAMAITTGCGMWRVRPQAASVNSKQDEKQIARIFNQPSVVVPQQILPVSVEVRSSKEQIDSLRRLMVAATTEDNLSIMARLDSIENKLDKIMVMRNTRGPLVDSMLRRLQRSDDMIAARQLLTITALKKDVVVKDQIITRNIYQSSRVQSILELIAAVMMLFASVILARNIYLTTPKKTTISA